MPVMLYVHSKVIEALKLYCLRFCSEQLGADIVIMVADRHIDDYKAISSTIISFAVDNLPD